MTLQRSQKVLDFRSRVERAAQYGRPEDAFEVHLPIAEWEDLGEPDQITVTVEPGDRLNDNPAVPNEAWQDDVGGR